MGVKTHYILYGPDGNVSMGPAAYHMLKRELERLQQRTSGRAALGSNADFKPPKRSWRKNIVPLFRVLENVIFNPGALKVIKCSNLKSDPNYRDAIYWLDSRHPRPNSPRN